MQFKVVAALLLAPGVFGLAGCAMDKLPSSGTYTYTENNVRMLPSKDAKNRALVAAGQVCAQDQRTLLPLESERSSTDTYSLTFRCLTPDPASERPVVAQNPGAENPSQPSR